MSRRVLRGDETFSDLARYRLEKQLLQYCDELILVTEETRQRYLTAYPFLKGRVTVLRNGYHDFFKFRGSAHEGSRKQFRMIYSGNFYHGMVPSEPFFDALKHIVKEQLLPGDRIFFHYVGASSHWIKKLVQERDLTDYVRIDDPVPREQLRHYLKASNAVLLRNYTPCISTKLYEGIAMGKPLLATVESREVETIIKSYSPQSIVVSPTDIEGIVQAICALYRKWEDGILIDTISTEFLEEYSWKTRTKRLAEVLDTVTCSNGRGRYV
ncbi:hypothetical protein DAMNIGENAA_33150 [Desulforhabdus amnigena]|uniref:Glycosyltransferase n=2 Tax=Desulforhabdus amnigena TaxID=40218 RepID=A0A9W6FW27_9BACT|nr:hypothetical protein DAMNIGENAA_33150 [Desulforhabdus amnigena]